MLTPRELKEYQKECILHMLYRPNAMLWLQMGLGKTIITLTTIVDLMNAGQIRKTLIFGPLRVVNSVWDTEIKKWSHTKHLTVTLIRGNPKQREELLNTESDIYLINYELMNWLSEYLHTKYVKKEKELPFDCVIYDEVSKLKSSTSLRMRGGIRDNKKNGEYQKIKYIGWNKIIPYIKYRYGLTGTPVSNCYLDLHGQYYAVDNGERLSKFITHYKKSYFNSDFKGWSYTITDTNKKLIENKIQDITKNMYAKDYLDLPSFKEIDMEVSLPDKIRQAYNDLEKEMFSQIDGTNFEVKNAVSLSNKCLQFANGSPYLHVDTKDYKTLHDRKLQALEDVLEEAAGSPVICSYSYKSDADRIMKHFKKYKPVNLTESNTKDTSKIIKQFNDNKIKLLIGHPASMGHGIDGLQKSCSILVWFGLNWSLELYEQMNGRIYRQGQTKPVSIIRILCNDTIDMLVKKVIDNKMINQDQLKQAIQRYEIRKKVSFL